MAEVKMIWDMPRTVFNWPLPGEIHVTTDEDAEYLVGRGYAEYLTDDFSDELGESSGVPAESYEFVPEESGDDFDNDFESDDFDSEVYEAPRPPRSEIVKKPRTVDSKSKWLTYARSKGYTGDDTITKNRLVAEYGD
jgi:hypothetical protein